MPSQTSLKLLITTFIIPLLLSCVGSTTDTSSTGPSDTLEYNYYITVVAFNTEGVKSAPSNLLIMKEHNNTSVNLTWTPPTQNIDGSALTNLAGYIIYYGDTYGEDMNSIVINNTGLASYVLDI